VTAPADATGEGSRKASPRIVIVVAVADNGVIGDGGRLPWRLRSDLRHFRAVTMGKPVVMGRKTFQSIGKPLAGRTNIVVSRDDTFNAAGAAVASSMAAALAVARGDALRRGVEEIAVIGGADVFAQTMDAAERLVVTRVHLRPSGDTILDAIDPEQWEEIERRDHCAGPQDDAGFTVQLYRRRAPPAAAPA
jgi:dihydrofolate reductase